MTLEQLRILNAVAELGTLKRASSALHKTQPAISQAIKQLEAQLGLSLFCREGYRLQLTDEGKRIYQLAINVLDESAQLLQAAKHLAEGRESVITIAFEASMDLAPLLPILQQVQQTFPETQIVLRQEHLTGAVQSLVEGQADLALSPVDLPTAEDATYELLPLLDGELINIAAPELLDKHEDLQHVRELVNDYQIVVQDSGDGTLDREFGVQNAQRRWYANDFYTKLTLIKSGMGWGKVPGRMVQQDVDSGRLVELKLKGLNSRISLSYSAVRMSKRAFGPVANEVWRLFSDFSVESGAGSKGVVI